MNAVRTLRVTPSGRFPKLPPLALESLAAASVAAVLGVVAVRALAAPASVRTFLLLAAVLPFVAILSGGLKRVLLAVAVVNISLGWDINFSYDADAAARGAIGGLGFSLTTIALVGLFALWFAERLAKHEGTPALQLRWALPGAIFLLMTVLSLVAAQNRQLSAFEIALVLQGFLLFVYVATFVRTRTDVRFIVTLLVLAYIGQSLLILSTRYLGLDLRLPGLAARTDVDVEGTRVAGTLGSPNTAGSYLAPMLLLAISLFVVPARTSLQRLLPIAIGLGAVALVLTLSRGAWLAFAVALVALLALLYAKRMISRRIVVLGAVSAIIALAFADVVADRFEDGAASTEARVTLFDTSVEVIEDHPWLGVGANNFAVVLPSYRELTGYAYIPHNKFALVWAEAGIGALVAFIGFVVIILHRSWLAVRAADPMLFPYAAGIAAGFLALCVHMNFEPFHGRLQTQLFWLLAGLSTALWAMRPYSGGET